MPNNFFLGIVSYDVERLQLYTVIFLKTILIIVLLSIYN